MIQMDLSHIRQFIPLPYEEARAAQLRLAHSHLQHGDGAGGEFTGWVQLPRQYDREEFARIQAAARKIQQDSQALVVIGIGGSYLGARGVIECLCSPNYNLKKKDTPNIYFTGNGLSSDQMAELMDLLEGVDFSVNIISKSGTTTEPAVAFRFFRKLLEERYGPEEAARRIYATTDRRKGALKALADHAGYETFVVPDDIGGRYSVLTAVGLLPIAVAGVDICQLMEGAETMMEVCAKTDMAENPAWQYAAARYELYRTGKKIEVLAAYEPSFRFMAEWWKQLGQNFLAAALVHIGSGFVQEDDPLILGQHTGQRQLLPFSAGQIALRVLEYLVQIMGCKKGVHSQRMHRRYGTFLQCRAIKRDILEKRIVKDKRVLKHDADLVIKSGPQPADVCSVHRDTPLILCFQPGQQLEQRALAASVFA